MSNHVMAIVYFNVFNLIRNKPGQWRIQEFLSSGQFPRQTILRGRQQWAIEKSIGQ